MSVSAVAEMVIGVASSELLDDIEKSRRIQTFCTWCGPVFVICLFGGWGLLGGFIPLIPPADSATEVAATYSANPNLARFGLIIAMTGAFLTIPFFLAISMQMRRSELRTPILAYLQFASGVIVTVVLMIPILLFAGNIFRPERSADLTRLVNDLSYVMLILPWPPILGQLGAIAMAVFADRRPDPVFPRWVGYYSVWVAVLLLPASMILFFKTGPFAWTGVIGFWIPAVVFGTWYFVMAWLLLRAVKQEAAEDSARVAAAEIDEMAGPTRT